MRPIAKSIPTDSTIEFLEERNYIKENNDGTYSWNFSTNNGEFFSYDATIPEFQKHFGLKYKAAAYRSIKEALHEIDLDVKQPKSWNIAMDDRKHRSITTEFGKWFIDHYGSATVENRKLYCRLYMAFHAGKIDITNNTNKGDTK